MQMQHCNNYQNNQDLSLPSGSDILPIIDPAERVRYMTCRLTSDISTKEFHHYHIRTVPYQIMKIETCGQRVLILFQVDLDDGPARMVVMSFLYRTIQKKKRRSSHRASCLVSGPLTPSYML